MIPLCFFSFWKMGSEIPFSKTNKPMIAEKFYIVIRRMGRGVAFFKIGIQL